VAKILLVDGNVQIRTLTKALIETRKDWEVSVAGNGFDAIVQVAKIKPDLIVLDFAMPGLNGLQAADKISTAFPKLPIILYTFYGFEVMAAEAKKHGICDVVDKTTSGEFLLQSIENNLSKKTSGSATLEPPGFDSGDQEEPPKIA
jgi:DNA-binding NtrC family response regulator